MSHTNVQPGPFLLSYRMLQEASQLGFYGGFGGLLLIRQGRY
jgi:hypothetical protein